jgi:hypothetical protein
MQAEARVRRECDGAMNWGMVSGATFLTWSFAVAMMMLFTTPEKAKRD